MTEFEHLDGLPVYDPKARHAPAKAGLPAPLAKKERAKARRSQEADFLNEVWARDQGRCRATGKPLVRSGSLDWNRLGEIDHAIPRSLAPDRVFDTSNGCF